MRKYKNNIVTDRKKIVTVLGGGAWGSALASVAARSQPQEVRLWSRRSSQSLESAVAGADLLVSAVSVLGVSPTIEKLLKIGIDDPPILVTATKGLDPLTTRTPSQIWQQAFPHYPVAVLSGPNLSQEIDKGLPAATVVASSDLGAAETVQACFSSNSFRVYVNNDPLGTELGGTLKNVMAIAAGVCDGLQLGTNAKASLLTRALPEMIRVGTYLGAKSSTFFGLSGLGDLLATCNSSLSRNYQVGYRLAGGQSLEEVLAEIKSTAEGVNTTKVLIQIADGQGLSVPIAREVYGLLQGETTPEEAVKALMKRNPKPEFGDLDL